MRFPLLAGLAALHLLSACSTVVEGRSQPIVISSSPTGAQCLVQQAGDVVARITTPGTATVGKSKNDLVISCSKDGYESVSLKNRSDMAITSFGNMAFYQLSFLGDAVDSATGASNKYDSKVFVELKPASAPTAFPMPPGSVPSLKLPVESVALMSMQVPMPAASNMQVPAVIAQPAPAAAVAASPVGLTAAVSFPGTGPALNASSKLGQAAMDAARASQPAPMTYAQQVAEVSSRPPFGVIY